MMEGHSVFPVLKRGADRTLPGGGYVLHAGKDPGQNRTVFSILSASRMKYGLMICRLNIDIGPDLMLRVLGRAT